MTRLYTPEFFADQQIDSLRSAQAVVPLVRELVAPASVIDVGCGVGTWLSVFREQGVTTIQGVDGTYVQTQQLHIPSENFLPHDLQQPLPLTRKFDLAMSLEVAEHLPESHAVAFVETLTRLAPVVLFSAAVPQQDGTGHLNEQWPTYWIERFARVDYQMIDCLRPQVWDNPNVAWWYAQNMFLYVHRAHLEVSPVLQAAQQQFNGRIPLRAIHPEFYLMIRYNASPEGIPLSGALTLMRGALKHRVLGRFKKS